MTSISVIIPTYNGRYKIGHLLRSLETQSFKDFETLIVIDGSTDGTAEYLKNATWNLKKIKIIEQENKGRAVVRNTGAKMAQGDHLVFFDDDMRPGSDVIERHIKHNNDYPNSILVGAQKTYDLPEQSEIQKYKNQRAKGWESNLPNYPKHLSNNQIYLTAAHFSISKETFNNLNGFDPDLTDAEDLELAVRAMKKNILIYIDTSIYAQHEENLTARKYIDRLLEYNMAHQQVRAKHPNWHQKYNLAGRIEYYSFKKMFYYIFSSEFWVSSLDDFNWLIILPMRIRYKLYDIIITAHTIYFPKKTI